jgi:hypothetical protein
MLYDERWYWALNMIDICQFSYDLYVSNVTHTEDISFLKKTFSQETNVYDTK